MVILVKLTAMQKRIQYVGIALTLAIFSLSVYFDPNYHFDLLYPVVVLLTIWLKGNRTTFDASVALSILIIVGFFIHSEKQYLNYYTALILPTLVVWGFTFSIIKYKESQQNLLRSTENLNAMFMYATEGIIISNSKGEIIMANPRSCEQFGYKTGELAGKLIEELIPSRFKSSHVQNRQGYYKHHQSRSMGRGMNLFAQRKDGTEFPVEISLSTFKNKDELFVISFIIDITERKKQEELINKANEELEQRVIDRTAELALANTSLESANKKLFAEMEERKAIEEALIDSERLFNTIARNFPDGIICVINLEMKVLFLDGKEIQKLDLRRDVFLNQSLSQLPFFSKVDHLYEHIQRVFNWESIHFETQLNHQSYNIHSVPLPDAKGVVKEALLVVQNTTEIKVAEEEMRQSLEKEKELNEMKSKFVSIASHEFRTPLSTILTSVSLISKYEQPEDKEKRQKHIDRIRSSVKNLTEILNDFLSVEKLEAGKVTINLSEFDFRLFCEELVEEMNTLCKHGQRIRFTYQGFPLIHSDKQHLRHICINLLNNAIKYSGEDSTIHFSAIGDEKGLTIKIKDEGIGIPAEDQGNLFDRFFRAGNVTAIQGTGLGLNIVKRYVELLKGSIIFESKEGEGTTFTLTFGKYEKDSTDRRQ